MKNFKEYITEAGFSPSQIKKLRAEWGKIELIDPTSKTYKRLDDMLENMSTEDLEKIAEAGIKFVSSLALAKLVRRKFEK